MDPKSTKGKLTRCKVIGLIFIVVALAFALIFFPIALKFWQGREGSFPKESLLVIAPMFLGIMLIFWGDLFALLKTIIIIATVVSFGFWFKALLDYNIGVSSNRPMTFPSGLLVLLVFGIFYLAFRYVIIRTAVDIFTKLYKDRQAWRTLLALLVFYSFMLVIFGMIYAQIGKTYGEEAFNYRPNYEMTENVSPDMGNLSKTVKKKMEFGDYFYFSVVTATTLGYGDICPKNGIASVVACVQVVVTMITASIFIGAIASSKFFEGFFGGFFSGQETNQKRND